MRGAWLAIVLVACAAGCFETTTQLCEGDNGFVVACPGDHMCARDSAGSAVCIDPNAPPDHVACSDDSEDGSACVGGYCHGHACRPVVCGDHVVDPPEVCDPPTPQGSNACAPTCMSKLACGDGIVDPGESCDDHNTTSHDGCDATCLPEFPRWTQLVGADPITRDGAAMAYDARADEIVMFGGLDPATGTFLDDTWLREHGQWRQAHPVVSPSGRIDHVMAFDGADGHVYLYGGTNGAALDDLWRWEGTTWRRVKPGGDVVPALASAGMVYDARGGVLVLFGGRDGLSNLTASTYELDVRANAWTLITTAGSPPARSEHAFAYDAIGGESILFGGIGTKGPIGDTWSYKRDLAHHTTTWVPEPDASLEAYAQAHMVFDGTRVVLAGGRVDIAGDAARATQLWDRVGRVWENRISLRNALDRAHGAVSFTGSTEGTFGTGSVVFFGGEKTAVPDGTISDQVIIGPPPGDTDDAVTLLWNSENVSWSPAIAIDFQRTAMIAALDLERARPVMFGGAGADSTVYELDRATWLGVSAPSPGGAPPQARFAAAAAYDEAHAELVMFGGRSQVDGDDDLDDTWTWRDAVWAPHPGDAPSRRTDLAMAYDANRKLVIAFGGRSFDDMALGDTWSWDGEHDAWTQVTIDPSAAPMPRYGHALAYDRVRGNIVMFGGFVGDALTNETWLLDADGWKPVPAPGEGQLYPEARAGAAMAWDPLRRRVVMVGGQGDSLLGDTWEWDGTRWSQLPIEAPPPRARAALVGVGDGVVLFGGSPSFHPKTAFGDAWLLRYDGVRATSRCIDPAGEDEGGEVSHGCSDPGCWLTCTPTCLPGDACSSVAPMEACAPHACTGLETPSLCPDNCPLETICGDGLCVPSEAGSAANTCAGECP